VSLSDLTDRLAHMRQLAEQVSADAEALASQQHVPHSAEVLRSIGDGAQFMTAQAQAMQQALERL